VSIEMIEAIGHAVPRHLLRDKVGRLLEADHGLALVQAITIEDHRYEQALRSVDFIKRHIFPGSFIPSIARCWAPRRAAPTCALCTWRTSGRQLRAHPARLARALPRQPRAVRAQGFDEAFLRMWEFYLCYCEGGFLERSIGDVQLLLSRSTTRSRR
jgi:cyclopropane-fatty-acyl-phospholipid synthase